MFRAKVQVTIKEDVLDPQGQAVERALHTLGYEGTHSMRIGKYMEFLLEEKDREKASAQVEEICRRLLANTVIEDYQFTLEESEGEQR